MLKLDLTNNAANFVTGLEAKQARQVWKNIVSLMKEPRPNDSIDIKEGYFRADIGEHRIVYRYDDTCLYVSVAGKRNDNEVYRQFKNKK